MPSAMHEGLGVSVNDEDYFRLFGSSIGRPTCYSHTKGLVRRENFSKKQEDLFLAFLET